jgi:hypothetical protein
MGLFVLGERSPLVGRFIVGKRSPLMGLFVSDCLYTERNDNP